MTKLKTAAITCMAVSGLSGWASAQGGTSSAFPTPSGSSSSSSVSAPRTGLYTAVTKGNAAADNTVDDYSRRPTLIGTKQYFAGYGGPDLTNGAFSFEGKGLNWFGSVTDNQSANLDLLRLGVGSGTAWGGGLLLSVDRANVTTPTGETKTTFEGDGLGLFGDFNLGSSDVYGQIGWFTGFPGTAGANTVNVKPNTGTETTVYNWYLNVLAGWKKDATTEGTHSLNAEFSYILGKNTSDGLATELDNSLNAIILAFYHGYILKATSEYSVFLGDNSGFSWEADKVGTTDGSHVSIFASPNIAFQKQLGHGFEGFSGASVTAAFDTYSDEAPVPPAPAGATDYTSLLTGSADVAVGLRWVLDNFALEGSLKEAVLLNGPYLVGGNAGQGLFANVGISLGI
jgi:hypothetical protein